MDIIHRNKRTWESTSGIYNQKFKNTQNRHENPSDLDDRWLIAKGHHPAISKINTMATACSVFPPYDLRYSDVRDGDIPRLSFSGEQGIHHTRFRCG